ncbi:MAG: hypothetical protein ABH952_04940 [Candidatus Omnitrophota bacterium]
MSSDFYNQAFKICEVFFKEGTKRFLDRQIEAHLSKIPETIDYTDKEALAKWVRISAGLILPKGDAEKLYNKICALK